MGNCSTEITLKNAVDMGSVQRGHMKEQEVRQVTVLEGAHGDQIEFLAL